MTLLTMRDVTKERVTARRLVAAQARIIEHEKKSAMMEVAGGAAHELNQPLTSVMTSSVSATTMPPPTDGKPQGQPIASGRDH